MELSKAASERVEAEIKAAKARQAYEDTVAALQKGEKNSLVDMLAFKASPFLMNEEFYVKAMLEEVEGMKVQFGEENPRYKAFKEKTERKKKAFEEALAAARAKARTAALEEAKRAFDAAQSKAEGTQKQVERLKTELGAMSAMMMEVVAAQNAAAGRAAAVGDEGGNRSPAERLQMLNTMRIKVEARVKDLNQEIQELQLKLAIDGGGLTSPSVKERELGAMIDHRIRGQIEAGRAKEYYERLFNMLQEGKDPPEIARAVRADDYVRELRRRVDDLEIRRDVLTAKGGNENAALMELKAEIAAVRKKLDAAKADAAAQVRVETLDKAKDRFETIQSEYDAVSKRTENLKADVGELANAQLKLSRMLEEEKGLREQLMALKLQIENVLAEQTLQKAR
jgi:hypothetical protein